MNSTTGCGSSVGGLGGGEGGGGEGGGGEGGGEGGGLGVGGKLEVVLVVLAELVELVVDVSSSRRRV